jgi:arylsulfatase
MGYRTPNIDRIANEGMRFTDAYAEQSCTAGRSSFITGQCGFRTGNTKVGMPGAAQGLQHRDVTIAQLLKAQGYATAQFGKNHLGDRNEHLPTVHGFDEFYGALYHLNASEEPELPDYPNRQRFPELLRELWARRRAGLQGDGRRTTRRWIRASARSARQTIKDAGPLTKKRMETCDDDFAEPSVDFLKRQKAAGKPVFPLGELHPHAPAHAHQAREHRAGRPLAESYHDTMIDHDKNVGTVLKALDDLGMADDTLVMYSTDNGPHMNTWPDGAMTPFPQREELELGRRLSRSVHGQMAWPHQGRIDLQRDRGAPRLVADDSGGGGRARREGAAAQGHEGRRHDLQGASRRLQPAAAPDRPDDGESRARSSTTSTTTPSWSACATTTGSSCSRNSAPRERCRSGVSRS